MSIQFASSGDRFGPGTGRRIGTRRSCNGSEPDVGLALASDRTGWVADAGLGEGVDAESGLVLAQVGGGRDAAGVAQGVA
jgi:hypothetical protein